MAKSRLQKQYEDKMRPALKEKLNLKNVMEVPKLEKIVINVGVKEAVNDSRALQRASAILEQVTGQKPVQTKARKSIASFKIREGMPIGVMVTLRKKAMYDFLDKFINLALPKVRDFQGVPVKFDRRGNYNLGVKEWTIFPETEHLTGEKVSGMNITIKTSATNDTAARALLEELGMPFRKTT